jgi:LPXTG-motif cell wall-anchored protein
MEVEYVVIPEVGTLAMMGIAFGSLAGITLYRRRKRV